MTKQLNVIIAGKTGSGKSLMHLLFRYTAEQWGISYNSQPTLDYTAEGWEEKYVEFVQDLENGKYADWLNDLNLNFQEIQTTRHAYVNLDSPTSE